MSQVQQQLDGTVLEDDEAPQHGALVYCEECDEYILPSKKPRHEHDLYTTGGVGGSVVVDDDEKYDIGGDKPAKVGGYYRVKKSYSVDVVEYVYAPDEDLARDRFPIPHFGSDVTMADEVHINVDEQYAIYEDDEEAEENDLLP